MSDKYLSVLEDIFGRFGFRVVWRGTDSLVEFSVYEVISYKNGVQQFVRRGANSSPEDATDDTDRAETYAEGFVKWDGCTEIGFDRLHFCGPQDYKKHIRLMKYLYDKAFEIMGQEEENEWDNSDE